MFKYVCERYYFKVHGKGISWYSASQFKDNHSRIYVICNISYTFVKILIELSMMDRCEPDIETTLSAL